MDAESRQLVRSLFGDPTFTLLAAESWPLIHEGIAASVWEQDASKLWGPTLSPEWRAQWALFLQLQRTIAQKKRAIAWCVLYALSVGGFSFPDREIAKQAGYSKRASGWSQRARWAVISHELVRQVRREMEDSGEIEPREVTVDALERHQPTRRRVLRRPPVAQSGMAAGLDSD